MYRPIKRFLVGNPISTTLAHHERLDKKTALAVFSSDAPSSVAYSTAAVLVVLVAEAGANANGYLVPIAIGLIVLMFRSINWHYRMVASQCVARRCLRGKIGGRMLTVASSRVCGG